MRVSTIGDGAEGIMLDPAERQLFGRQDDPPAARLNHRFQLAPGFPPAPCAGLCKHHRAVIDGAVFQ